MVQRIDGSNGRERSIRDPAHSIDLASAFSVFGFPAVAQDWILRASCFAACQSQITDSLLRKSAGNEPALQQHKALQ
jgi:hypothetical protein